MIAAGALGFADDYLKVSKKNSAGVRERTKLVVQLLIATGVAIFFIGNPSLNVQAEALFVPRRPGEGAGSKIGLFVSRGVAEAQGGRTWGEVADDRLVFHLELPTG